MTNFLGPIQNTPYVGGTSPGTITVKSGKQLLARDNWTATSAPTVNSDTGSDYREGSRWYNTSSTTEYVCIDATSGAAVWKSASGGGGTTVGGAVASGAANRILYEDASNELAESANLTFDGSTGKVGIGTSSPASGVHISSADDELLRLSDPAAGTDAAVRAYTTYFRGDDTNRVGYAGFTATDTYEIATTYTAGKFRVRTGNNAEAFTIDSSQQMLMTASASTNNPLTVKAAASQSANLTEWTDSSDTVGARITAALEFSNPTTHADASERFGAGAGANMGALARNTAFGRNAMGDMTAGYDNAAFGHHAFKALTSNSSGNAAFGNKAGLDATNNIGLTLIGGLAGHNILTGQYNTCIGYSAGGLLTTGSGNIILGANADTDSNSDSRLFVAGSDTQPIDDIYFGKGITNATPTNYTVHGTGGSGTNIAGSAITVAGGQGTGTGAGGDIIFQYAAVGSSGSSANALATALTIGGSTGITTFSKSINLAAQTELTIASGAITKTKSYHSVDTESDASSDDLNTISGGTEGDIIIIKANNTARTVVVKNGVGNLITNGDYDIDDSNKTITFIYDGTNWLELSRSVTPDETGDP